MPIVDIEIKHNPVTLWESFNEELNRDQFTIQQLQIRDIGYFWGARFNLLNPTKEEALEWLNNGPGREVNFYNEKSNVDFQGFINTVKLSNGRGEASNSLNELGNKVWVRYQDLSTGNPARSTVYEHAQSQAKWGIKEWVLNGGEMTATNANNFAQSWLDLHFWASPEISRIDLGAIRQSEINLEFSCLGWWHTLLWRVYNQTVLTGTTGASAIIILVEAAVGQFIASTDIHTNSMAITREYDADRWAGDVMEGIAGVGLNNFPWVVGVNEDRNLFFRQSAPAIVSD